jgi:flavin-dependent dehydrogenase
MSNNNSHDVIVIGAGPAGSAAGALLAEQGHRVLVLERERFPRYHIGESLLPFTFYPLQRLGLVGEMRRSAFVKKYSVQFISTSGKASQPFYFFDRYAADVAQTWQVLRSEFDLLLLDNARRKGAEVLEGTRVTRLLRSGTRVVGAQAVTPDGVAREFHAPLTLDASGREAVSAAQFNWRVQDPFLRKFAVWTYYEGALRDAGLDAGATTVAFVPEKGWFWYIPQHDDRVSVGVVAEGPYLMRGGVREPARIFGREVGQSPWIERHLECGRQVGDYFITNEYSYRSRYGAADGLVLLGDAFGFLDPVFSSGVMLALKSGVLSADAAHAALLAGDCSASRFAEYGRLMRGGLENMRKLVYAFYHPDFSFRELTDKYPDAAGEITDCLSGDVNKDFSRLYDRVAEFVPVPEPLPYGAPVPASVFDPAHTEASEHAVRV